MNEIITMLTTTSVEITPLLVLTLLCGTPLSFFCIVITTVILVLETLVDIPGR